MKKILLSLLFCASAFAENRIKIAIIDTGVSVNQSKQKYMCGDSKSLIDDNIYDEYGHGTNIISIISENIDPKKYCIVAYKVWKPKTNGRKTTNSIIQALHMISQDSDVGFLNISMEGEVPDFREKMFIKRILDNGVNVSVAAGNGDSNGIAKNLNKKCSAFPACYRKEFKHDNFHVVTAKLASSNYGNIVTDIFSGYRVGIPVLSGTSQATAQKTAQLLKSVVYKNRRSNDGTKQTITSDRRNTTYR